ncbi:MAG: sodium:solute symporter family protein [candidate division Zixibacteria bacterium]|jgi:SSS family solute:Na+ symporter/sodium/proline symporter|nr:sodium:solute symporter family protein [candidate division Zixibacteria bacterium]
MVYFWVTLAYLVLLIVVGAWRSTIVRTQDDFMVAGRRLSARVLVGTLLATWIGSGSIIAGAGLAYEKGLAALWFDLGVWIAIVVLYLIAGRVRRFAQYTVPDILETRYNRFARLIATVVTIIAYTAIVSYQFRAGGMVLNLVAGIPVDTGILITAAFVIGYTVLAGMISVAYTDVVNGIVMLLGLTVALPFMLDTVGGWDSLRAALPASHFAPLGNMTILEALGYTLPTMLLLLGESGMYQRFFSAQDERAARRSVVGWILGTIFLETLIVVLGVVGHGLYGDIDPEMVILHSVKNALPVAIGCLALAAIVAAIISTADSFLLVPATNFVRDIYQRFVNPGISQTNIVRLARVAVVMLGVVAFLQLRFFETVLEMALYAYTMYGVAITPALLASFFWKRATAAGGVSSMLGGMTVTLIWESAGQPFGLPTVYPALLVSLSLLIFISLLGAPPPRAHWQPFFD